MPAPSPLALAADLLDPPHDGDLAIAQRCAEHLPTFIREAWPLLEPATPYIHSWHIDVICEHLQAVSDGELLRLIINQPPRTMKSITSGVCWPAWDWMMHPSLRWVFASYAASLSIRDSVKCRRLVQSLGGYTGEDGTLFQRLGYQGVLKLLGQDWDLTGDQNEKTKYETTETGLRLATSVDGMATGEGGNRIVVDDPLNAKKARSETERQAANTWWDETMTTRFNNAEAAGVIVMQRLHEDDLSGHLLAQDGEWLHLCLPAEYEPTHQFVYPDKVFLESGRELPGDPRTEPGELLEPVRLSRKRLDDLHKSLGSYGYAGQMQQRPAPAEGGMFKAHWWKRWTHLPPEWERLITSWDMRFGDSEKAASSFVVGQVWGVDGADRYLVAQIRARLSFTESVKAVEALAAAYPKARTKLVEDKANGPAVISTLKHKIPGLTPVSPEGGKEVRAAAAEPYVEAGNVYLPAADFIPCPAGYEPTSVDDFIGEHSLFPNGSHDDQVDGMTQAINWLENRTESIEVESYRDDPAEVIVDDGDIRLVGEQYIDQP